ncbi:MAG: H-NS family nucleoid-associated regulatory protein [Hylemonella sp.]
MGNLIDIQQQIEKLQKQAADIRAKEFDRTVREIVAQMQAFGITLKDLQQAMGKGVRGRGRKAAAAKKTAGKAAGRRRSAQAGKPVAPKYRGPNGETWSGRGLMPKWLAALVAQGRSKEEFAVN